AQLLRADGSRARARASRQLRCELGSSLGTGLAGEMGGGRDDYKTGAPAIASPLLGANFRPRPAPTHAPPSEPSTCRPFSVASQPLAPHPLAQSSDACRHIPEAPRLVSYLALDDERPGIAGVFQRLDEFRHIDFPLPQRYFLTPGPRDSGPPCVLYVYRLN